MESVFALLEISGEGSKNEGADRLIPILNYLLVCSAPRKIFTSIK
jgi:hypothetical protein